jgi:regulator of nucleoside diphosphate kinase
LAESINMRILAKSSQSIVLTDADHRRLAALLESEFAAAMESADYLSDLRTELERAQVVAPENMPHDVVTMDSTVRLYDLDAQEPETYTLVYPHQANIASGRLSVLAPIGTAILGQRIGDIVRWRTPGGVRRLRVDDVIYQPERERAFHL